jgi:hypothetical protein
MGGSGSRALDRALAAAVAGDMHALADDVAAPPAAWIALFRAGVSAMEASLRAMEESGHGEKVSNAAWNRIRNGYFALHALVAAVAPQVAAQGSARAKQALAAARRSSCRDVRTLASPPPPARSRRARTELRELASVGTEGGPVVVVPATIAGVWTGTSPPRGGRVVRARFRHDDPDAAATDYDEACDRRAIRLLGRPGGAVLVLPEMGASFARGDDRSPLWCVIGSVETAAREAGGLRWKRLRGTFTVGAGGVIAVDAAYPARSRGGSRKTLAVPPGEYRIDVAGFDDARGELQVARLTRM